MSETPASSWPQARAALAGAIPQLFDLGPGGALGLELHDDGWVLEITPEGRLLCQYGIAMEDVKSLTSDGTTEDLGTDELAKQAKYFLQPAVAKFRSVLRQAGFEERTDMNDQYVAVTFDKAVNLDDAPAIQELVRWCQTQFAGKP